MKDLFDEIRQTKTGERFIVRRTRETSKKALKEITDLGVPHGVRGQLMLIFNEMKTPLTIGEIWLIYIERHPNSGRSRNEIAKRISELKEGRTGGARIREVGKRRCVLTGREVMTYEAIK